MKNILLILLPLLLNLTASGQTVTKIFKPDYDAALGYHDGNNSANINEGSASQNAAFCVPSAFGSGVNSNRALIHFNLTSIPTSVTIISARLSLYHLPGTVDDAGNNTSYLQAVTSAWNSNTVTWNTQPSTTTAGQVTLPKSVSGKQDYLDIDVTNLVQQMIAVPSVNYGFMLRLTDETIYKVLYFSSIDCGDTSLFPKLVIKYSCSIPPSTISALRDTICSGTPAILSVTAGSGNINWQSSVSSNKNFTGISGATDSTLVDFPPQTNYYRVVESNGGCADTSAAYKIVVKPSPVAVFTFGGSGLNINFNSSGSSGDVTSWDWNFGDGDTSAAPNPQHTYTITADSFHVCLTVENGSNCSYTLCKDVRLTDGIIFVNGKKYSCSVYPNPTMEKYTNLRITGSVNEEYEVSVTDVLGRQVKYLNGRTGAVTLIDKGDLPAGIYVYKVKIKGTTAGEGKLAVE